MYKSFFKTSHALHLGGREKEARAEASEVLRVQPKLSAERFGKRLPFKDQAEIERLIEALRKAGLK
jgi:hypothetical protein